MHLTYLCGFAFLAGFVDSVVGGGGLIQTPALLIFLPESMSASVATVFGTNKLASICGTGMAVIQYSRRVSINWRLILPSAVAALVFSFIGARAVSLIDPHVLKPIILGLLVTVALYTFLRRDFGALHAPLLAATAERWAGVLVGIGIGFYDGFFGPGTGSFLIFIFISIFGFDFLTASASAKIINFATNLSAVIYFGATGHILYYFGLPMAICNVIGSFVGSRLAILKGNAFVRVFFLVVVIVMILRFGWEVLIK